MFNLTVEDVRGFYFNVWEKYKNNVFLEGIEKIALDILINHPEYHAIFSEDKQYTQKEWEFNDQRNPFLHMSLHLAVMEQLSIDQPLGIRHLYSQLILMVGNEHKAQHVIIECLAEMLEKKVGADFYLEKIRSFLDQH